MSITKKAKNQLAATDSKKAHNAFIYINTALALARAAELDDAAEHAHGSLHGMTLAIKDNIEVAGLPLTAGHATCSTTPDTDCTIVANLRAAGAIFLGKTNLHELARGATSNNARYGAVGCAFDVNTFGGGSSGGSAVAVALELCDAGLGSDTAGSIRIPASLNGIVGFKPTIGRYKMDGVVPISFTRDMVGPMTRDVRTAAVLDAVMAGEEVTMLKAKDPSSIRLGLPTSHFWTNLEDYVRDATHQATQRLLDAGVTLVPVDVSHILGELASTSTLMEEEHKIVLPSIIQQLGFTGTPQQFVDQIGSPDVREVMTSILQLEEAATSPDYQHGIAVTRPTIQHMYYTLFTEHQLDGLLFPATKVTAQQKTERTVLYYNGERLNTNTNPASYAGLPSLVVPAGRGARVGVEIDGAFRRDRELLAVGLAVEEILLAV